MSSSQYVARIHPLVARASCPDARTSKGKISMKVRPACAAVDLIGTSLLLLVGIRCTQAAEIEIVSPSAYESSEGEGAACHTSEEDDCLYPPARVASARRETLSGRFTHSK